MGLENLTIVIPCLEEVRLLQQCLDSIAVRLPGQKVLVVKMGTWSPDQLAGRDLDLRILTSPRVGAAAARNLGARAARSEYIFCPDSDCILVGPAALWQARLKDALARQADLVILGRAEAGRRFSPGKLTRWNFSRHCIEWTLIWARDHFFALGGLDESYGPGSATAAQAGEGFALVFRHFEQPRSRTIMLPKLLVSHPSLSNTGASPQRQFEYAYGSNYVAMRQLRRRPSLLSLFWFIRTTLGISADLVRGLRARSLRQTFYLVYARYLAACDALLRDTPRPRERG
ncbi:MAG TPA: glycosyltransferase [Chloroflexia bacterium]|nr:glycosyltransferase [Chloroflexia bacterium]